MKSGSTVWRQPTTSRGYFIQMKQSDQSKKPSLMKRVQNKTVRSINFRGDDIGDFEAGIDAPQWS